MGFFSNGEIINWRASWGAQRAGSRGGIRERVRQRKRRFWGHAINEKSGNSGLVFSCLFCVPPSSTASFLVLDFLLSASEYPGRLFFCDARYKYFVVYTYFSFCSLQKPSLSFFFFFWLFFSETEELRNWLYCR
jgi:hypothetical protein